MKYGIRFKKYREKAGLTQNDAAKIIGVKGYQLANYETGRSEPSIDVLKGMSKAYNISIDHLVGNNRIKADMPPIDEEVYDVEAALQKLKEFVEQNNKK